MKWILPGTVLEIQREDAPRIEAVFSSMFLAGGMALGQVAAVTGLEPYTVQNWVKRGLLHAPEHKRYSMNQLCRIITINMLKNVLPMERICGLIGYVNGRLDDEEDDIIDDAALYFLFVRLASRTRQLSEPDQRERILREELAVYDEPAPGARERVGKALRVMLAAWTASAAQREAERLLDELEK